LKTVGILGAGQLGCMLAAALQKFGARVRFFDVDPGAPGAAMTPHFTNAPWTDLEALSAFFSACDVVTYEFENVDVRHLAQVEEATGVPLWPSARVLAITQSRAGEKDFLASHGLPCAPYRIVSDVAELANAFASLPCAFVAKTLRGGYDGKGQRFVCAVGAKDDLLRAAAREDDRLACEALLPCLIERALPLSLEASVIVGRAASGEMAVFPPFENVHSHHILDTTLFPSPTLSALAEVEAALVRIAKECANRLGAVGLLTTEFFLVKNTGDVDVHGGAGFSYGGLAAVGEYLIGVNEFAPRPHNSGHVTREACFASQFDLHARILLGLPLPAPEALGPVAPVTFAMGNLLGDTWIAQGATSGDALSLAAWNAHPEVIDVTLYGKARVAPARKMGHFTLSAPDAPTAIAQTASFRAALGARVR